MVARKNIVQQIMVGMLLSMIVAMSFDAIFESLIRFLTVPLALFGIAELMRSEMQGDKQKIRKYSLISIIPTSIIFFFSVNEYFFLALIFVFIKFVEYIGFLVNSKTPIPPPNYLKDVGFDLIYNVAGAVAGLLFLLIFR